MRKRRLKPEPERVHLHAYERVRRICAEIQRGRFPNKVDLSRIVERHPRTVQRDLDALKNRFDAPLEFDRARNGFYFSDPGWRMPPIALTQGELISFFAAERILKRLGASAAEASLARDAVRSLASLLPSEVVVDLDALEEAISFAPEPVLDASPDTLRKLASAAAARQTLFIRYYSQRRAEQTEREVDVLLLHNHLGEWYAVCFDHLSREVRDFHAGRITYLANTRRQFAPPADWDPKKYLESGFGMFRGGKEIEVEVEFDAYQARYARERKFHPTQRNKPLRNGRLRISFKATEAALGQVARWLLQYGEHAIALRPKELRDMVREHLKRAASLYDQTTDGANNE
jgi:predicted DNA-binding transcriptional regulator YafY